MNHCNAVNSLKNYLYIYRLYYINKKNKIEIIIFIVRSQICQELSKKSSEHWKNGRKQLQR